MTGLQESSSQSRVKLSFDYFQAFALLAFIVFILYQSIKEDYLILALIVVCLGYWIYSKVPTSIIFSNDIIEINYGFRLVNRKKQLRYDSIESIEKVKGNLYEGLVLVIKFHEDLKKQKRVLPYPQSSKESILKQLLLSKGILING